MAKKLPPPESPLVPHAKLKLMYERMVGSRLLEERLREIGKSPDVRGQEACRVSVLIDLFPDDLVSDLAGTATAAFLRGAEPGTLLGRAATSSQKKQRVGVGTLGNLPAASDIAERFAMVLGAAFALKQLKVSRVAVAFTQDGEAGSALWRRSWSIAAAQELPMLFVVLPAPPRKKSKASKGADPFALSAKATAAGVPGIPVDASDAIALYRVAAESIGRARAGGGPALMECTAFLPEGAGKTPPVDPLEVMAGSLLDRGICDRRWIAGVTRKFEARLRTL